MLLQRGLLAVAGVEVRELRLAALGDDVLPGEQRQQHAEQRDRAGQDADRAPLRQRPLLGPLAALPLDVGPVALAVGLAPLLDRLASRDLLLARGLLNAVPALGLAPGVLDPREQELVVADGQVVAAARPGQRVLQRRPAQQVVVEFAGAAPALDQLGEPLLLLLGLEPLVVIDLGEDQVARAKVDVAVLGEVLGDQAGQAQLGLELTVGLGLDLLAVEHPAVQVQQLAHPDPRGVRVEALLRVGEVGVAAPAAAHEQVVGGVVDPRGLLAREHRAVLGEVVAQPLAHVGVAGGPHVDGVEQGVGVAAEALEAGPKRPELGPREVVEADLPADVEGRAHRVLDQVRGRGDPQQAEGQALVLDVLRAQVVGRADRGEEVVGREG